MVTTCNPTTLPPGNPAIADSVAPNTSKQYTAICAPTALDAANGSLTITHNVAQLVRMGLTLL
ncbi:hypothetical protein [Paraburkholderia kirstenboschensis]|uniref:hypothetical protein n=1 Tax=Paraburkholderia kirstenboschensis TaxID=1245436 RepID=UPI000FFC84D8|nr:hypothetical protein [Paraburkholderia kirstenboschensis]